MGGPEVKKDELLEYHRSRAMRELDLGLSAALPQVARAHLTLSSLHLQKVRQIGGEDRQEPLLRM
jgi:hypothetical protein